jgi:hypothetical protein
LNVKLRLKSDAYLLMLHSHTQVFKVKVTLPHTILREIMQNGE